MRWRRFKRWSAAAGVGIILLAFLAEAAAVLAWREGDRPLPPLFGNFEANRRRLAEAPLKEQFTLAVFGDTMSIGTFERLSEKLREARPDVAVMLGDCAYDGSEAAHRFLRAEAPETSLRCPTFYVVGNHDVSPDRFPISRFEETYGPSMFSFEYQGCLFIVLRVLDTRFDNREALEFLKRFTPEQVRSHRYGFAFMHLPLPMTEKKLGRKLSMSDELLAAVEGLGIDWVFAGDYHGYARVQRGKTNYIVTGGGGGHLKREPWDQFHHAVILRVTPDGIEERIVPVERDYDIEDAYEKAVFLYLGPFAQRHGRSVLAANVVGLAVLAFLASALRRTRKRRGPRAEKAVPD
jgi:hypothetical protein